jgi:hypothetical protein
MNTKGFLLLLVTVIAIGGSIGGAFAGGLALGRSQNDDADSVESLLQQRFGGAIQGGQFGGATGGQLLEGGALTGQDAPSSLGEATITPRGPGRFGAGTGTGETFTRDVFNGTVTSLEGNILTVAAGEEQNEVDLSENASIQFFGTGTVDDISQGDRVLVIVSGDTTTGGPVDAVSVIVNPPEGGGAFGGGGGGFAGRGGPGGGTSIGILNGTVGEVSGSGLTVATESGETQVNLRAQVAVQIYETGTAGDISAGDRVLVITSTDDESGDPVTTTSIVINPPEGGGFGGGEFGGRRQRP